MTSDDQKRAAREEGSSADISAPEGFRLSVTQRDGVAAVEVSGGLDVATAPRLREVFDRVPDGVTAIELDLGQVTFIDSTALGVLANAYRRCSSLGATLRVTSSSAVVAKMLDLSGLGRMLGGGSRPGGESTRPAGP